MVHLFENAKHFAAALLRLSTRFLNDIRGIKRICFLQRFVPLFRSTITLSEVFLAILSPLSWISPVELRGWTLIISINIMLETVANLASACDNGIIAQ